MFAKQWLSTLLFLAVLIAGALGPHPLTLCEPSSSPALGRGRLVDAALAAGAPRLAFALTTGVLLADPQTMSATSFWPMPRVRALVWSPDLRLLLVLDAEGGLHAIEPAADRARWSTSGAMVDVAQWLFKPDLGLVALAGPDSRLRVFRLSDGAQVDDPGLTSAAFWAEQH
ncbi:MAG: hypothetical protein JNL73_07595 [Anaerolineales bacterium]|nr:hypothetical protein [Anaerolineales bacterium]